MIPCYDGFTPEEKREKIKSALSSEYNGFPTRLRNVLNSLSSISPDLSPKVEVSDEPEGDESFLPLDGFKGKLPQGIKDSIDAVGRPCFDNAGCYGCLSLHRCVSNRRNARCSRH